MSLSFETTDTDYSTSPHILPNADTRYVKAGVTAYSDLGVVYSDLPGMHSGLVVQGSVLSGGQTAISSKGRLFVNVVQGGLIEASPDVFVMLADSAAAVVFQGFASSLENQGVVSSFHTAVALLENLQWVTNAGLISGRYIGIDVESLQGHIRNSGMIQSESYGVFVNGAGSVNLENSGQISSTYAAITVFGYSSVISNTGKLYGGTYAILGGDLQGLKVVNSGHVEGVAFAAMLLGNAADVVQNSGTIVGTVELRGGADRFDGRGGFVQGEVRGGDGGDTYFISDTNLQIVETSFDTGVDVLNTTVDYGLAEDQYIETLTLIGAARIGSGNNQPNELNGNHLSNNLSGNQGSDTILGGGGADVVSGGLDNDTLGGGDDADTLDGGTGLDRLFGESGDDVLRGRAGADSLDGGIDEDRLLGGLDGDTLTGGAGDDTLQGGGGTDVMYGGTENDVFVFTSVRDSRANSGRDVIGSDFTPTTDIIDLSAIDAKALTSGNDAFTFIGTAAFTAATAGQVRYLLSGTNIIIQGDVNGDALADFEIQVNGQPSITAASFVL